MPRASSEFNPASIDAEAFFRDVQALRAQVDASLGEADAAHLRRIERWGRWASALGLATCWLAPNPLSAAALSLGRSTRWLLMHHVGHRGYDKVPGVPVARTSKGFARGPRRFVDWLDWMLPEAWVYEHNVLHHSHTGEEALTNLHTFLVVGPNHTGEDLYRFDAPPASKAERYVQQVLGSANYATGGDATDYAHLWLNYQIEHHLFPDLPMLKYREVQPLVRALCERHGLPYVQQSVWTRARKMVDVVVGLRSMRRLRTPASGEASGAPGEAVAPAA